MPSQLSRIVLVLCLTSAGTPLIASPAPRANPNWVPTPVRQMAPAGPLGWLWNHLTAFWAAAGCGLDPSGVACGASSLAPGGQAKAVTPAPAGCGIDPSGC